MSRMGGLVLPYTPLCVFRIQTEWKRRLTPRNIILRADLHYQRDFRDAHAGTSPRAILVWDSPWNSDLPSRVFDQRRQHVHNAVSALVLVDVVALHHVGAGPPTLFNDVVYGDSGLSKCRNLSVFHRPIDGYPGKPLTRKRCPLAMCLFP